MFSLSGGCTSDIKKTDNRPNYYFDLKGYFDGEAIRLDSSNLLVEKSVSKNNDVERKKIRIKNWAIELDLFISSDINKTAWKNSYTKDSSATKIGYKAKSIGLKTRSIVIYLKNQKPNFIRIINHQKNYLFENTEILKYYQDSVYQITKKQKLLFRNWDVYFIEGKLK